MFRKIRGWLNEPTPRKQMLPAYLILMLGMAVGLTRFEDLSSQRADDVAEFARTTAYNQCVIRVETRDSLRGVLFSIAEVLPSDGLAPDDGTGSADITEIIESDYPKLNVSEECGRYLEDGS